jgi:truncated hemoglobin YjbI
MKITRKDSNLETFFHIGGLSQEDQNIMARIAPAVVPYLADMTDRFYTVLQDDPQTSPYVEGRLEALKATHLMWMKDLFSGNYGEEFIQRQEKIGEVHVRVKVPPVFVAASMSFLRAAIPPIITQHASDQQEAGKAVASLLRLLDLCQYLIDRKYSAALMDNLGISPALLMRLQTIARS